MSPKYQKPGISKPSTFVFKISRYLLEIDETNLFLKRALRRWSSLLEDEGDPPNHSQLPNESSQLLPSEVNDIIQDSSNSSS